MGRTIQTSEPWPLGDYIPREEWNGLPESIRNLLALAAMKTLHEVLTRLGQPPQPAQVSHTKPTHGSNVIAFPRPHRGKVK